MFVGDLIKTRRHTINVLSDLDPLIEDVISYAENNIIQLDDDMKTFQKIVLFFHYYIFHSSYSIVRCQLCY